MAKQEVLTARQVRYIKADPKRRQEVPAGPPKGLYLVVQPSGVKSWALRYRFEGRPRKLTINSYPGLSLAAARAEARQALDTLDAGTDPAAPEPEPEPEPAQESLPALVDDFIQRYARPNNKSWRETRRILQKETARWANVPVEQIGRREVFEVLDSIVDRGAPIMANRTLAALARFFSWLVERGVIDASPAAGIKPVSPEQERDRTLTSSELGEIWQAADRLGYPVGSHFQLLILTAQRRGEVATMRWSDIDLEKAQWTLPKEATKAARAHDVPLAPMAVELIRRLPKFTGEFVLTTTGGRRPLNGFSKAKTRIDAAILQARRAKSELAEPMPGWTYHDLRRTATTIMAEDLNILPHVLGALLNHSPRETLGITRKYIKYDYLAERREALEHWARFLADLLEKEATNA